MFFSNTISISHFTIIKELRFHNSFSPSIIGDKSVHQQLCKFCCSFKRHKFETRRREKKEEKFIFIQKKIYLAGRNREKHFFLIKIRMEKIAHWQLIVCSHLMGLIFLLFTVFVAFSFFHTIFKVLMLVNNHLDINNVWFCDWFSECNYHKFT